jgi:hypothetical protein
MKRAFTLAAALLMVVAVTATAFAETVNAGLVKMEKADFQRIQGLVSGSLNFSPNTPAAEKLAEVDTGLVKMSAEDLAALQDYVTGRAEFKPAAGKVSGENMVNVGLVEISDSDLVTLTQMVQQGHAQRLALLSSAFNR